MKLGRSISELAVELERQVKTKRDFLADTPKMRMVGGDTLVMDLNEGKQEVGITRVCHQQLAETLDVPQKFYNRLKENHPDLLDVTVNKLFIREPMRRMVRTLDNNARAFVSDRYRALDNYDLAETILPIFRENDGYRVESCELTERRMFIKVISDKVEAKVVGDVVQSGIVISNSEIGCGALKIEPLLYTLSCKNGAIANQYGMKRYHVGKAGGVDIEGAAEYFADETRRADDKAYWMKVRDVVRGSFNEVAFKQLVGKMERAAGRTFEQDPAKVVEIIARRYELNDDERGGVLKHLAKGGDLSQYGILNAVTRQAQDVQEYERATEMERLGGEILELTESDFEGMMREADKVEVGASK